MDAIRNEFKQAVDRAHKSETPVVITHFRNAAGTPPGISNTHPFHWRDWVFAHDGTIFGAEASLPLNETAPNGETDSERFFLWIWEQVHATADPTAALAALLKKARETLVFTSLNFLMSDGQTLWAYREFGDKRLGKGETLEDREKTFTLYTGASAKHAIVSSDPLQAVAKKWQPVGQRTLVALTVGKTSPQTVLI
jgi:glutamine amidotransferase